MRSSEVMSPVDVLTLINNEMMPKIIVLVHTSGITLVIGTTQHQSKFSVTSEESIFFQEMHQP